MQLIARLRSLVAVFAALVALASNCAAQAADGPARPNVVFILADDK